DLRIEIAGHIHHCTVRRHFSPLDHHRTHHAPTSASSTVASTTTAPPRRAVVNNASTCPSRRLCVSPSSSTEVNTTAPTYGCHTKPWAFAIRVATRLTTGSPTNRPSSSIHMSRPGPIRTTSNIRQSSAARRAAPTPRSSVPASSITAAVPSTSTRTAVTILSTVNSLSPPDSAGLFGLVSHASNTRYFTYLFCIVQAGDRGGHRHRTDPARRAGR